MALKGQLLGDGRLDGARLVRVYEDLDSDQHLILQLLDRDGELFVAAERVQLIPRPRRR